ncbi:MAG: hypothetical protein NVSMB6_25980 [Burkholderiaceae bacterium]
MGKATARKRAPPLAKGVRTAGMASNLRGTTPCCGLARRACGPIAFIRI